MFPKSLKAILIESWGLHLGHYSWRDLRRYPCAPLERHMHTANSSPEGPCRCWREEPARELDFPKHEGGGGCSCNISEWPLTHGLIKLKLLAQKHGQMSCSEYESRIHILTHSWIKSCLFWGDSYMIPLNSGSFVILTGCPLACTLEIHPARCSQCLLTACSLACISICLKTFARLQSPHPHQGSVYFIWVLKSYFYSSVKNVSTQPKPQRSYCESSE